MTWEGHKSSLQAGIKRCNEWEFSWCFFVRSWYAVAIHRSYWQIVSVSDMLLLIKYVKYCEGPFFDATCFLLYPRSIIKEIKIKIIILQRHCDRILCTLQIKARRVHLYKRFTYLCIYSVQIRYMHSYNGYRLCQKWFSLTFQITVYKEHKYKTA